MRWRDRITTASRSVALTELDGRLSGVVSWGRTSMVGAPCLELMSLYVAPTKRGSGLGAQLLRYAVGDQPAHVWVFEDNVRAQAFYRIDGFLPDGRRGIDVDTGLPELHYSRC